MVFLVYKKLAQFAVRCALPPRRPESPVCATDHKPSFALHLLGWFIGSRGFSSLERRPEFWVLQEEKPFFFFLIFVTQKLLISTLAVNTVDWLGLDHFSIRSPSIIYGQGGVVTRYQHGCWESTLWTVEFSEKEK